MKQLLIIILFPFFTCLDSGAQTLSKKDYREDFDFLWQMIQENYAYKDIKKINWEAAHVGFIKRADTVSTRRSFISLCEDVLYLLYDHHANLGTRNPLSSRLVPTGSDIWAQYEGNVPRIIEVRKDFGAARSGIRSAMEVVAINGLPVDKAISPFLSAPADAESRSFALRVALAGNHLHKRKITLRSGKNLADYFPDADGLQLEDISYPSRIQANRFGKTGYLKINNCLFDNALIGDFDKKLDSMMDCSSLILDLRETPSGGNTTVARAILGRFIEKDHFYQKHELIAEEWETGVKRSWAEIVSPRGKTYRAPMILLVDHWTGSVGEGIAIAFDGIKRAQVIGTRMAGLCGAISGFTMPHSKIDFNIPIEKLYHINGDPREKFSPKILIDQTISPNHDDEILKTALKILNKKTIKK